MRWALSDENKENESQTPKKPEVLRWALRYLKINLVEVMSLGSIIVALPKIEEGQKIARHLVQHGIHVEAVCKDGRDVLVKANEGDNGIAIVSSRFSDMNAVELYDYLPDFYDMIVIGSNRNFDFPAGIANSVISVSHFSLGFDAEKFLSMIFSTAGDISP